MKKSIPQKLCMFLHMTIVLSSCNFYSDKTTNKCGTLNLKKDFVLSDWQVTGAFCSDSSLWAGGLIDYPVLAPYAICEDSVIIPYIIRSIEKESYTDSFFYVDKFVSSNYSQKQGYIDLKDYFDIEKTSIIFLSCNIKSAKARNVAFLIGNDDACSVYLNRKKIHVHKGIKKYKCSGTRVFGKFNKGNNFLLVKLGNVYPKSAVGKNIQSWRFSCNMCSIDRFYRFYLKNQTNYLSSCVVPHFFSLELKRIFHESRPIKKIQIRDSDNKPVHLKDCNEDFHELAFPKGFKIGLYSAHLITAKDTFEQTFYYGDIENGLTKLICSAKVCADTCLSARLRNTLNGLIAQHGLLHDHYRHKNGLTIEQEDIRLNKSNSQTILSFPSRWIELENPTQIDLSLTHNYNRPISEIRFYRSTDPKTEAIPIFVSDSLMLTRLADNKQNVGWSIAKNSNLILIGNQNTNMLIKGLYGKILLKN